MEAGDGKTPDSDGGEKEERKTDESPSESPVEVSAGDVPDGKSNHAEPAVGAGPLVNVTEVVKKGPALFIRGQASFPLTTADALIDNIVLGKEITDYEMFYDDDETDDGMPKDVDKGWAWMVLFGGFMAFSLLSGLFNTMSIYYVVFLQAFNQSKHYTAWASSLHCAFSFLGGPLSSVMILRVGCRWTIIAGGLISAIGYLGTSFAPNLETVLFTYGIVTALGLSLNFSGWVIALGTYFNKKHSIATALAMTGFGCGLFFLGPGMEASVNHYGWRGSFIINAGIALHFCVFGALVYPITFSGYVSECEDDDEGFERKFFKDWEETQSLPPPESERLHIDGLKPVELVKTDSTAEEVDRKVSTIGELRSPPAAFMRPTVASTTSVDSVSRRTAFAYVPGKNTVSELRSKRTHSSSSIRSVGSASSMQGSMRDMRFSPAAAFMSHSIRSLQDATGQPKSRRAYITVGLREGGGSNSSLPFLTRSQESVRSLDDNFRLRSTSFRDELLVRRGAAAAAAAGGAAPAPRPKPQVYRKPQPVEEVENVAEDLGRSLNDPQVVSLKPKKPTKAAGGKRARHQKQQHEPTPPPEPKAPKAVKEEEKKPEGDAAEGARPAVPVKDETEKVEKEEKAVEEEDKTAEEKAPVSPVLGSPVSSNDKRHESGSEMEEEDDDDDDGEEDTAEVWKLKATIKAAQRAQPPRSGFLRFFMPAWDANPRAISNIEEVDESSVGSLMSLNALFRRKSREVLSKLSSDPDLKGKDALPAASVAATHLPGIKEEKAKEDKTKELPAISEEDEKKHRNKDAKKSEDPEKKEVSAKDEEQEAKEKPLDLGTSVESTLGAKAKSEKQMEEAVAHEVGLAEGSWRTRLTALWRGEHPGDVPLFKDPRFWCFNYSGLVWIMGTLTLYVLYKDFAQEKGLLDRFIYALSGLGLGDLMGRLMSGTFVSWSCVNSVLIYALVQLACGVIILYHMTIVEAEEFIILCVCLGVCYGTQNVLLAVAPAEVYGSSHLTIVFGYILFFCGIGAILGPPVASLLVQHYDDYAAAFVFAGTSTLTGGVASLVCFAIDWKWRRDKAKARKERRLTTASAAGTRTGTGTGSGSGPQGDIELAAISVSKE